MNNEDRKKLIQKFGKTNFGEPESVKRVKKYKTKEIFLIQKPVSAFNMARRV